MKSVINIAHNIVKHPYDESIGRINLKKTNALIEPEARGEFQKHSERSLYVDILNTKQGSLEDKDL